MANGKNQGEGNVASDARYRAGARRFVDEGRVADAAADARAAVDGPEADELRAAERRGKAAVAEDDDRDHELDPVPSFWTPLHQSGWDRIKAAVKLAMGSHPSVGLDWDLARQAIRLGYGAAAYWPDDKEWGEPLEGRLRAEWFALGHDIPWDEARKLVRYGWDIGRKDFVG
jgi:hypothetical protein